MDQNSQRPEQALPGLIRKVLGSPHSEQVIKAQIIQMASRNLHVPEVTTALLEVLPLTKDKETRTQLLQFLAGLNTSRFTDTGALFQALLDVYRQEKDRDTRTALLYRLQESIHQDPRLAAFFVALSGQDSLSEAERIAVQDTLSSLPSISEDTALAALQQNVNAPTVMQLQALDIAEKCPSWSQLLVAGLQPYLDVKNDREVRFRILRRLAGARLLEPAYADVIIPVLRTDPETYARAEALNALSRIKPWKEEIILQLFWSATNDSDESIRSQALRMQSELPERTNEQLIAMAALLGSDRSEGVRATLLQQLKPVMRIPEIRTQVATAFSGHPGVFASHEFDLLTDMLAPYAGRDEQISQLLLQSIQGLPNTSQRQRVLQLLIGKISMEKVLEPVIALFRREHNETLREVLFNQIKALSVARHPQLVDVFCAELTEPGSPFRITCAGILANAAEIYAQIPPALEDVLLYDNDRELVRLCLDGYLRPGVDKKFDILINVVKNELADTLSRQKALDATMKLPLDDSQQEMLADALSGLKPGTLKTS
ncbi:HEAT repeat domain-containing protein [Chitinophaga flava]|uniref:HEAT repeat domain-containing protein n=1 Tax=Chitinophaga flava TaxID=2259036 RepID=A0A365XU81_9BACT|nr:HEAT repeat domain-containing protein [Chitinophaga flava]RBL89936.1 hypothetical protein DF182_26025 [Chitinophaga flava]